MAEAPICQTGIFFQYASKEHPCTNTDDMQAMDPYTIVLPHSLY